MYQSVRKWNTWTIFSCEEGIGLAVGRVFCGGEFPGAAGCALTLFAAPGVKVGQLWLPLCVHDARYMATFANHRQEHADRLAKTWEITGVHDGEHWTAW